MKKIIHKANTRGHADHGWLNAHHTFSFAGYYDPSRVHFGVLRVLNDDIVAPGMGFGKHPHDNMEIITIPLKGALAHKDSMGNGEVIRSGEVQIMSAGTGIYHSEMNPSPDEEVNLLQIWVFPKVENIKPRYEQKAFDINERRNKWQIVVSPKKEEEGVWINQDAWFSLTKLEAGQKLDYLLHKKGNGAYIFMIEGTATIAGELLTKRDGLGISDADSFELVASNDAEILVMDIPMN